MKIAYNVSAMIANNSLTRNDDRLTQSLQRLSSGLKVVNAKDNPSGLAMGKRMNAQLRGLAEATQNASDGISIVETADGAMSEIHEMLQRMNELCVKASTGTLQDSDRDLINDEITQLNSEITRIANETEFNGQKLLDGSFDLKGYTDDKDMQVNYYSDDVQTGKYKIAKLNVHLDADGNINLPATIADSALNDAANRTFPADAAITGAEGNVLIITGGQGFEMRLEINGAANSTVPLAHSLTVDVTGIGAMDMQIGANEGQILGIRIPKISLKNMGIDTGDASTADGARKALDAIDKAVQYISDARSRLGAYQNRLEHTVSSLDVTSENMTAAYSRIMDVDMATEMTEYTTMQVISQASTTMLAQANERPSQVLQLLQ